MPKRASKMRHGLVIFTDLDGTLLDSRTYDFTPALPALDLIQSRGVPLILVSSKTRAEIEVLRRKLAPDSPFISENGGAIFFPQTFILPEGIAYEERGPYKAVTLGRPIEEVLDRAAKLKGEFRFRGFSEMSCQEIAALTQLNQEEALLASKREFDEPIVLENFVEYGQRFCKKAVELGLECVTGGRFIHLSMGANKGRAVERVLTIYRELEGPVRSVGLGDSPNDIPMLEVVDKAVVMLPRGAAAMRDFVHSDLIWAEGGGPEAWSKAILAIVEDLAS
jgi:mannosyl-3-phosphoglycerate phosphatase